MYKCKTVKTNEDETKNSNLPCFSSSRKVRWTVGLFTNITTAY